MASGLLSSTPMYSALAPTMCAASRSPSTTAPASSTITRWSALKNGSHSAPLRRHRVDGLVLRRRELHMRRERRTAQADDACLADGPQQPGRVVHIPLPAPATGPTHQAVVPITTDATRRPPATTHGCMPLTLPETIRISIARDRRVHRGADIPVRRADLLPMYTRSPAFTSGLHGAPHAAEAAPPPPAPASPQPPSLP